MLLLASAASAGGVPKVLALPDQQRAQLPQDIKDRAIQQYGLRAVAVQRDFLAQHSPTYSCEIPDERAPHRIRDQKNSGRCWIYATDRVLRSMVRARGHAAPELSTTFINYHTLRQISRGVLARLAFGKQVDVAKAVEDADEGGFNNWAIDIVRRKGIVPKRKLNTTADGACSALAIRQLQTLLAAAVRDCAAAPGSAQRREIAVDYAKRVDKLLNTTLGEPPQEFTYRGKRYTPKTFRDEALGLKPQDLEFVTLTNDPNRAWYQGYVHGKCTGMPTCVAYNVPVEVMQRAATKTIKKGEGVYFSTNYDEDQNPHWVSGARVPKSARGVLSVAAFDYAPYIPQAPIDKRERLRAGISESNHAMAITGFDTSSRRAVRKWKVENSHGPSSDDHGHLHMYDDFFRQYVDEVVVPLSSLPKDLMRRLQAKKPLQPPKDH